MGKLNYEPHIKHFSHEHPMELINIPSPQQPQNKTKATICSGCKEIASPGQWIYTCKTCYFNLHIPCSQMPKVINHPSDPNHPLILLPAPAYPCGSFNCDGCGRQKSTGFSYHCTACSLDLHILCAAKPLSVNHHAHPAHPLSLAFHPPYDTNGFSCDICHKLGMNHWLYHCASCGFDAHIGCADNPNNQRAPVQQLQPQLQPQPVLQHHYSFQGATHQPQFMPQGLVHQEATRQPQFMPQGVVHQGATHQLQFMPQGVVNQGATHQPQFMSQRVVHQGIPMINNNMAQPSQQQRLYHANSSPNMGVAHQMTMSTQQTYGQQQMQLQPQQQQMLLQPQQQIQQRRQWQQQQLPQQLQQQQNTNVVMNMAIQGVEGASQQLGQSLIENVIGGGGDALLSIGSQILDLVL